MLYCKLKSFSHVLIHHTKTVVTIFAVIMTCSNAQATLLSPSDLPSFSSVLLLNNDSVFDAPNYTATPDASGNISNVSMSAYQAYDLDRTSAGYLLQYQLAKPSNKYTEEYGYEGLSTSREDITGQLWMFIADSYRLNGDASASHEVTLYYEKLSSPITDIASETVTLTDAALLAGSGYAYAECCGLGSGPTIPVTMDAENLQPCVAEGCWTEMLLNLLFVNYEIDGDLASLSFDNTPTSNGLVLQRSIGFDGVTSSSLAISQVPVPAASWLFTSALILLGRSIYRHNGKNKS